MRACLLVAVLTLSACGFTDPPPRADAGAPPEDEVSGGPGADGGLVVPLADAGPGDAGPEGPGPDLLRTLPDGGTVTVEVLARESRQVWGLTVHEGAVYYTVSNTPGLRRWSADGGVAVLAEAEGEWAFEVVIDGDFAYWARYHYPGLARSPGLFRTPLAGGPTGVLTPETHPVFTLTHAAGQLYWLENSTGNRLRAVPMTGGTPAVLASFDDGSGALGVDESGAYVATRGAVWQVPLAGGTPRKLADLPEGFRGVGLGTGVEHVDVLVTQCGVGGGEAVRLLRVPKAGGPLQTQGVGHGCGDAVAMDATHAYWLGSGGATTSAHLQRLPRAGGPVELLVPDVPFGHRLALDDSHVYWMDAVGRRLLRTAKVP